MRIIGWLFPEPGTALWKAYNFVVIWGCLVTSVRVLTDRPTSWVHLSFDQWFWSLLLTLAITARTDFHAHTPKQPQ